MRIVREVNADAPPGSLRERDISSHAQNPSRGRRCGHHLSADRRDRLWRRLVERRVQRLAEDAHVLGVQPGRQHRDRQEDARPRTGEVREADRHQGEAGGRPLVRPAEPHPHRHHLRPGPRRPQHRQHLERLPAGHRRAAAVGREELRQDRRQGPLRRLRARLHRRGGQGPRRGAAVLDGVRALLQQEVVRRRRYLGPMRPPGPSWSPTARSSPRAASGASAPRVRTPRRTSTTPSSSPSSTAPTSSPPTGRPTSPTTGSSPRSSSTST